ncbi:hypothetical protein V1515DRAFT_577818 [Lipomyces mesembrius]
MPPDENVLPDQLCYQAAWFSPYWSAGSRLSSPTFEYASPSGLVLAILGLTLFEANERIELKRSLSGLLLSPVPIVEYTSPELAGE